MEEGEGGGEKKSSAEVSKEIPGFNTMVCVASSPGSPPGRVWYV